MPARLRAKARVNPFLCAAALGAIKGFGVRAAVPSGPRPRLVVKHLLAPVVFGPAAEEVIYRVLPNILSPRALPLAATPFAFAADHVLPEMRAGLAPKAALMRFADVFLGGLLYELSYRQYGYFGAVAAHGLHNLCVDLPRHFR